MPIWWARDTTASSIRARLLQGTHSLSMTFHVGVMDWIAWSDWACVPQSEPPIAM